MTEHYKLNNFSPGKIKLLVSLFLQIVLLILIQIYSPKPSQPSYEEREALRSELTW